MGWQSDGQFRSGARTEGGGAQFRDLGVDYEPATVTPREDIGVAKAIGEGGAFERPAYDDITAGDATSRAKRQNPMIGDDERLQHLPRGRRVVDESPPVEPLTVARDVLKIRCQEAVNPAPIVMQLRIVEGLGRGRQGAPPRIGDNGRGQGDKDGRRQIGHADLTGSGYLLLVPSDQKQLVPASAVTPSRKRSSGHG